MFSTTTPKPRRARLSLLAAALLLCCLSGCMYSRVTFPLDTDVDQTRLGSKIGRASSQSVLWLVAWGDSGTQAAARNGGIQVINHLDVERHLLLMGAYTRITTIAYGD